MNYFNISITMESTNIVGTVGCQNSDQGSNLVAVEKKDKNFFFVLTSSLTFSSRMIPTPWPCLQSHLLIIPLKYILLATIIKSTLAPLEGSNYFEGMETGLQEVGGGSPILEGAQVNNIKPKEMLSHTSFIDQIEELLARKLPST